MAAGPDAGPAPSLVVAVRLDVAALALGVAAGTSARVVVVLDDDDVGLHRALGDDATADAYARLRREVEDRVDLLMSAQGFGGTTTVPNAVVLPEPTQHRVGHPPQVVMTSNFTYLPNVEGLASFNDRVWPRIEASSGAELVVLGPGSDAVSPSGLGLVADLGAALEQASVMVVPLPARLGDPRQSSLDGMAHALPVVGTTLGMEGLEVRFGHDCLVADSADAFSGAVLRLLDDPATAARIGAAGRSLVADRYALPVVAAEIVPCPGTAAVPAHGAARATPRARAPS